MRSIASPRAVSNRHQANEKKKSNVIGDCRPDMLTEGLSQHSGALAALVSQRTSTRCFRTHGHLKARFCDAAFNVLKNGRDSKDSVCVFLTNLFKQLLPEDRLSLLVYGFAGTGKSH